MFFFRDMLQCNHDTWEQDWFSKNLIKEVLSKWKQDGFLRQNTRWCAFLHTALQFSRCLKVLVAFYKVNSLSFNNHSLVDWRMTFEIYDLPSWVCLAPRKTGHTRWQPHQWLDSLGLMQEPLVPTDLFLSGEYKWFQRTCGIHQLSCIVNSLSHMNTVSEWSRPVVESCAVSLLSELFH